MRYHAHVYWQDEDQRARALDVRSRLVALGCEVGTVWDQLIGPHPRPSYQANYDSANAGSVESLLATTGLAVLLHEDTGDDMRDHTDGARWLGKTLNLDLAWLEDYSRRKQ